MASLGLLSTFRHAAQQLHTTSFFALPTHQEAKQTQTAGVAHFMRPTQHLMGQKWHS